MKRTTFVGLDVHKQWINVAVLLSGQDTPIEWRIVNEPQATASSPSPRQPSRCPLNADGKEPAPCTRSRPKAHAQQLLSRRQWVERGHDAPDSAVFEVQ
jgi:hypothetical protein